MQVLKKQKEIPNDFIAASRKHVVKDTPPHIHEFFEIEYVIGGSGVCEIDGKTYPIQENRLFLLTPAHTHAVRNANAEIFNVMFRCEYSDEFFSLPMLYSASSPSFSLSSEDSKLVFYLLSELIAVHKTDIRYARLLLGCVLQKLSHLTHAEDITRLPYIRHALLYITEEFRSGVTLESTASHLGLSTAYFSDLFVREIGQNFKVYLDSIRFSHAKNLLAFTNLPICEIPLYSGFGDYANFSRRFRRLYRMTPGEYRKTQAVTQPPQSQT